eukprot:gene6195-12549_t
MASFNLALGGIVQPVDERTREYVNSFIDQARPFALTNTSLEIDEIKPTTKYVGKVRDIYVCENYVVLVSTDRQSAFDRQLAAVPFKGQVLNLTSKWWFDQTKDFVPNHIISCPHPNITICKKCTVFPIEFVMRGYITGSTSTSMWTNYAKGVRDYCGHLLPEGLIKNQKLDSNKLTPTTKDDTHDELISEAEIISSGRMTQEDYNLCKTYAHAIFSYGQKVALEKGLILVDTKYEFGKDSEGNILLIDEIQTPDSSRYWIADTYETRMASGQEPDNIDKEFLRKWYVGHCDPYKDEILPEAPPDLVNELSRRYIMIYEIMTGSRFEFNSYENLNESMAESLKAFTSSSST